MATKLWQNGQICNFCSEPARDLILVSIPRFLGMGNPLGPFSDTSDWPEWPKRHLWPFMTTKLWQNGQICNFCSEPARDLILPGWQDDNKKRWLGFFKSRPKDLWKTSNEPTSQF